MKEPITTYNETVHPWRVDAQSNNWKGTKRREPISSIKLEINKRELFY